ncbi:MAG: energy-coupled thiamine transporter ThiT [Oscillospiraceae bacterium]|jgi:thiamine transporter|nr:energy-coupled thiamine transporter ThiT [Oscillospiraceae bacterium]
MKTSNVQSPKNFNVLRLTETALLIAMTTVLSLIPMFKLPFGGTVTLFSQLPIIILAYRHGTLWGIFGGGIAGLLQIFLGLDNFSYVTGISAYIILIFSDYIFAFGSLGLGGVFKNVIKKQPLALACGVTLASFTRFLFHFISGVTIWRSYAPSDALDAVITYSITYNALYMLPELIITLIGAVAISGIKPFRKDT